MIHIFKLHITITYTLCRIDYFNLSMSFIINKLLIPTKRLKNEMKKTGKVR